MTKQKILLILTEFPPDFGGMQTHAEALAQRLTGAYTLEVCTYKPTKYKHEAALYDRQAAYPIHRILSRISFYGNIGKLHTLIMGFQPHIIYSSTIYYGILQQTTGIPVICRSVGNDILRPWIIYPFKWGSGLLSNRWFEQAFARLKKNLSKPPVLDSILVTKRKALALQCAQSCELILGNSWFTQKTFSKLNVRHCISLPGGVDSHAFSKPPHTLSRQEIGLRPHAFVLMTACRFVAKKGLDFLIDSFQLLEQKYPDLQLALVGDGPLYKKLTRRAKSKNVLFIGKKSIDEIKQYYWNSNLFVLSSRVMENKTTGYRDAETMGRVLCEANAAGVPVLASNTGGVSSIITHEHNGLLYTTDNYADFEQQFARLYANLTLQQRLVANGLQRASREFDWSVILQKHFDVFEAQLAKEKSLR